MRKIFMWWFDCVIFVCIFIIDDLIYFIKYYSNMIVNVGFIYLKLWDNIIFLLVLYDLKVYTYDLLLYYFYIMYFSNKNYRWVVFKMLILVMYLILGWFLI